MKYFLIAAMAACVITIGVLIATLLESCAQEKAKPKLYKLNISVTYNNGDVDTFYNVVAKDSLVWLEKGDVSVMQDYFYRPTIASNVRKFTLIK